MNKIIVEVAGLFFGITGGLILSYLLLGPIVRIAYGIAWFINKIRGSHDT